MTTRRKLCQIKGISEAKMEKIKVCVHALFGTRVGCICYLIPLLDFLSGSSCKTECMYNIVDYKHFNILHVSRNDAENVNNFCISLERWFCNCVGIQRCKKDVLSNCHW